MSKAKIINWSISWAKKCLRKTGLVIKYTIIFDVHDYTHFRHLKPILDHMLDMELVRCILVAPEEILTGYSDKKILLFTKEQFDKKRVLAGDAFLSTEFFRKPWWLSAATTFYVSHGTSPKLNYAVTNLEQYDVIMTPGAVVHDAQEKCAPPGVRMCRVGLPVTDQLANQKERAVTGRTKKMLLYAPTWNLNPADNSISESVLQELLTVKDWEVVIRPHPMLLRPEKCGGVDWREIINRYVTDRLTLLDDPVVSTYKLMEEADLLIGDVSSVVYEFALLNRPIIVVPSDRFFRSHGCEDEKAILEEATTVLGDSGSIAEAIKKAMVQSDYTSKARERLIERYFFNVGNATDAALRCICGELGIQDDNI